MLSLASCAEENRWVNLCQKVQSHMRCSPTLTVNRVMRLNWLGDPGAVKIRHDWKSYQQGRDFCRYYNTCGSRSYPIWEYNHRVGEQPPFAKLRPARIRVISNEVAPLATRPSLLSNVSAPTPAAACTASPTPDMG